MDPALSLMLLDPADTVGISRLAEELLLSRPQLAAALQALLPLPLPGREAALGQIRASFDPEEPQAHPFLGLPGDLRSEFLAHHRSLVSNVKAMALGAEAGTALSMPALRRDIHTLKGEAGIVGLEQLAAVWHRLEERIASGASPEKLASELLLLVSTVEAQLEVVAAGGLPTFPPAPSPVAAPIAAPAPSPVAVRAAAPPPTPPVQAAPAPAATSPAVAPGDSYRDEETVAILGEFLVEASDGVTQADELLMRAEQGDAEPGDVDTLFRTFHSMKGVAAGLEVDPVATVAHEMENLLSGCRDGRFPFQGTYVKALLDGTQLTRQVLEDLRVAIEQHRGLAMPPQAQAVLATLRLLTSAGPAPLPAAPPAASPAAAYSAPPAPPAPPAPAPLPAMPSWLTPAAPAAPAEVVVPVTELPPQAASNGKNGDSPRVARIRETVKVDLERVDLLAELIGEMVIAESMVAGRAAASANPELRNALRHMTKIVRDLQRMGIGLRMVPLTGVFQKMRRLVRDLCVKIGKEAVLVTIGDGIEMDRSLVEQVADPLVHILRNALDHGLETPSERLRAGKNPQGTVTLSAAHEFGNIVIEVRDDGRGMNRDRIRSRAVERGLISAHADLSDTEIYELIFAPGFSTAEQVTEVSGRGVGMDVVKRNVEAMGGRVRVESRPGQGSTIRLTLPLTLAIIDGMLISCTGERFIVPTRSIVESLRPAAVRVVHYAGRHTMVDVRGTLLPLVRLDRSLGLRMVDTPVQDGLLLVVDGITRRFALLVDDVVSRQQVVIKAMDGRLIQTPFYSGACILADGRVGLILNMDALLSATEAAGVFSGVLP